MDYTTEAQTSVVKIYFKPFSDLKSLLKNIPCDKIAIITDSNVKKLWGKAIADPLSSYDHKFFEFPAGEKSKNFKTYEKLCESILDWGISKKSLIIVFGGGVVGNVGGFVAGTLYRGLRFIHIPTTVMAQADSTTGGKQAINSRNGKNAIGIIYEPEFILIDTEFLKTLPLREKRSGVAECIKHAICQDGKTLVLFKKSNYDHANLSRIIEHTVKLKLKIIAVDKRENNEGKILVYGHTLGHALETLAKGRLVHGEAISIGMCCAATISHKLGYLSKEGVNLHYALFQEWNLPTKIPKQLTINKIIAQLKYDKKLKDSKIELILLKKIGEVQNQSGKNGCAISEDELRKLLLYCY